METIKPCRNCNNRCIDSLRTHPEQICRPCLKVLSRTICMYCQKDFHQLQKLENCDKSICWKCEAAQKEHGEPLPCHFCCQKAAFGQKICRHCQKDSEKYGTPIECDSCRKKCAFLKPSDLKQKVGGKNLCYLCTRSYKLMQHRNKKQNKSPNVIDITWNNSNIHHNKRSLEEVGLTATDDPHNNPHKRPKLSHNNDHNIATNMNPMCFGCKSMKHTFDEYKLQMQSKLSETSKRVDDYQRMADKAKRKADQYRREKLSAVERIGELNGELEKERRKYHRDISVKREHSETENKRLRSQLTTAQIELRETQSRVSQLEKNNETLKRNKKEFEKVQKLRGNEEKEWEKKYQKLEEKLNSKREKLKNWKTSYDNMSEIAKENEMKLSNDMKQIQDKLEGTQQQLNETKEAQKETESKYMALLKEKESVIGEIKMENERLNEKLIGLNDQITKLASKQLMKEHQQKMMKENEVQPPHRSKQQQQQYQQQQQQQQQQHTHTHPQAQVHNYQQQLMRQIVDSLSPTEREKLHAMTRVEQEKWFQSKMVQHQQQMSNPHQVHQNINNMQSQMSNNNNNNNNMQQNIQNMHQRHHNNNNNNNDAVSLNKQSSNTSNSSMTSSQNNQSNVNQNNNQNNNNANANQNKYTNNGSMDQSAQNIQQQQQQQNAQQNKNNAASQNKQQQQQPQAQFAANLTQQQMMNLTQRGYTVQPSPNSRGYLIIPPQPQQQPTYNQAMFIQPQYQMSSALYGNSVLMPQQQIYIQQQPKNANQQTQQY